MSAKDTSVQTAKLIAKLEKLENSNKEIMAVLQVIKLTLDDVSSKVDGGSLVSKEKKAPVKRRMDILTFVKQEYIKDGNFFANHIDDAKKAEIIGRIQASKKLSSPEEKMKKEAIALWKHIKEIDQQKHYNELKGKATIEQNSDLPGIVDPAADMDELLNSDEE